MGRKTLSEQIAHAIGAKGHTIGDSRHEAKNQLKEEYTQRGEPMPFGASVEGIYSTKTLKDYKDIGERFARWCVEEQGQGRYTKMEKVKPLAIEYLKQREQEGKSLYTLKTERAALGKLFGEQIPYKFEKPRTTKDITRSRGTAERDKNFSEERNKDLVTIAKATGARRADIAHMRGRDFFSDEKGNLWVRIEQSKGGRDRIAPVLPAYREEVQRIATERQNTTLFDKIHNAADIHSYRREYAKDLYALVSTDPEKKEQFQSLYPPRNERATGEMYHSRGEERFHGLRDDIYIVSEALGHNRLDVTVSHYLK